MDIGEIKQDTKCLDTLGNQHLGTVAMYKCHGSGGNQVGVFDDLIHYVIWCVARRGHYPKAVLVNTN